MVTLDYVNQSTNLVLSAASSFFLLFALTPRVNAQRKELVYDIIHRSEKIGVVKAIQTHDGLQSSYHIETHVSVRIIFSVNVDIVVKNSFTNQKMTNAYVNREVNGTVKTNNTIFWNRNLYYMINKDKDTSTWNGTIAQSVSLLYFAEPVNVDKVFSENFLQYVPVKKTEAGTYQVSLPDGHINYFKYRNGICTEVQIETMWSTVYLKLNGTPG